MADGEGRLRWWDWLIVVAGGVVVFVLIDWVGSELRIPNVRVGAIGGTIAWLLLSPLMLKSYH